MLPCASPGLGTLIRSAVMMPKGSWWLHHKVSDAKKLRKVSIPVFLMPRVCTWWSKGPVRGQSWGRRWELCSQFSPSSGQAEPSLSAWFVTGYLMSPPAFIWIFQEHPVGPGVYIHLFRVCMCSKISTYTIYCTSACDSDLLRKPNWVPNAPGTLRKTILEAKVMFRQKPAGFWDGLT